MESDGVVDFVFIPVRCFIFIVIQVETIAFNFFIFLFSYLILTFLLLKKSVLQISHPTVFF